MCKKWLLICLTLILSGCVTAEGLKKMSDEQLKRYPYDSYGMYDVKLYRQEILRRHPEWPEEIRQLILKEKVRIGMTREQAKAAWGVPIEVNRTTTAHGTRIQWVLENSLTNYRRVYLYFDNDILTSIQN